MENVNERMYQANIELVDKNKLLEEDKLILTKRIEKVIKYIEQLPFDDLTPLEVKVIYKMLKGNYLETSD